MRNGTAVCRLATACTRTSLLGATCCPDAFVQAQWNAKVAVYQTRADRLTVLKLPFADIIMSMVRLGFQRALGSSLELWARAGDP